MLARIVRYSTSRPKRVIVAWLAVCIALGVLGGLKAYSVTTDDTAQFLPKDSESAQAVKYGQSAFGVQKGTATVTVLVKREDGAALTRADRAEVGALTGQMRRFEPDLEPLRTEAEGSDPAERAGGVVDAVAGPVAGEGRFQLVAVQWKANTADPVAQKAYEQFRDRIGDVASERDLRVGLTGGIATVTDAAKAGEVRTYIGQGLLFGSVLVLSFLFLRGVLAAILPLLTILVVAGGATGLIVGSALLFDFQLDQSTPQLITVVLLGIGVDYFLFLLFRVRERLRAGDDRRTAATNAGVRVAPVIASAALAIVAAFATLGLAEFGQFRVLGPSVAIAVLVMLAAGLTLMPAITAVTGPKMFWPSKTWRQEPTAGPAARLGVGIARRPARTALVVTVLLVALAGAALGTKMDYDLGSGGPDTAATRTADEISASLPEGASDLQQVYLRSDAPLSPAALEPLRRGLAGVEDVGTVAAPVLTDDGRGARIDVALDVPSMTAEGMAIARGPLREAARDATPPSATVMVGGTAAVFADVSDSIDRDLKLVFPIAAGLIFLILVVVLRSALAPVYLLVAVALEFAASLGAATLVFQTIGGAGGVAFTLPLVLFLFVVALGTDYNILITHRLREELLAGRSPRQAVAEAVRRTAPTIAAAGLVLAACFGTLMLEADETAKQMGFAMAFGILLASLVVSTLLVPAITALVGTRAFWPSRAGEGPAGREGGGDGGGREADDRRGDDRGREIDGGRRADDRRGDGGGRTPRAATSPDGRPREATPATTMYVSATPQDRDVDRPRSRRTM
jgi:RND superfamily putative drug exporter